MDGTMRKSCKSDLVKQLENEVSPVLSLPDFDPSLTTYIRDGMALVQCMNAKKHSTFGDRNISAFYDLEHLKDFVWAVTLVRRSLSANLMEFFTSYRSNTSATVCAFTKHDVNGLQ
jgi:hypothetical protein